MFGRHRRIAMAVCVAVSGVFAVSTLGKPATAVGATASPSPAGGVVLRVGWTVEPDNLNPFIGFNQSTYELFALNYDLLFGFGANQKPTLDLAREFPTQQNGGISPDGKVWTIHLRTNARWQDGQPVTADDVAFTYNYIVKNNLNCNEATMALGIVDARALDRYTVRITCSRPKADMEYAWIPIVPKHIWEHVSPKAATVSFDNNPPVIGSGPFQVVQFKRGSFIHLIRNPYYWGKKPAVSDIYFSVYQNSATMASDLKDGTLDAAWGFDLGEFRGLTHLTDITALSYHFLNWDYLNFNCYTGAASLGNPVLRDWRFRNALNYAIDKNRICQIAFGGNAEPATTIVAPNSWSNPDYHWQPPASELYTFDLTKAGSLLDQAGYRRGPSGTRLFKGKPITLRLIALSDDPASQIEAKQIAGWLRQLGLKIEYSVMDTGALEARIYNFKGNTYAPDFDTYIWNWDGWNDPGEELAGETTAQIGATNEPGWSNAAYDRLNNLQAATLDLQKRKDLIWSMQKIMYVQTPWLVLTYPHHLEAYNIAKWTGWTRVLSGNGPVIYQAGNIDTYLNLRPVVAAHTGGSHVAVISAIIAIAVALLAVISWVWLRRRRHVATEEQ